MMTKRFIVVADKVMLNQGGVYLSFNVRCIAVDVWLFPISSVLLVTLIKHDISSLIYGYGENIANTVFNIVKEIEGCVCNWRAAQFWLEVQYDTRINTQQSAFVLRISHILLVWCSNILTLIWQFVAFDNTFFFSYFLM